MVLKGITFPCGGPPPVLLDGGTYDNTGLEALDSDSYRHTFLVTLNAGGLLRPGPYGRVPVVKDLARANSLLYRQSTALRTRMMVERFQRGEAAGGADLPEGARRGVLVGLATDFSGEQSPASTAWRTAFREVREHAGQHLALVPTVFDRLDPALCRALVYRGWWLAGAALARYHPQRLGEFSNWTPPEL
jgi:NTE family protein